MSKTTRLVIYVTPELKRKLKDLAKAAKPETSSSKMAAYLIELGIREYAYEEDMD